MTISRVPGNRHARRPGKQCADYWPRYLVLPGVVIEKPNSPNKEKPLPSAKNTAQNKGFHFSNQNHFFCAKNTAQNSAIKADQCQIAF